MGRKNIKITLIDDSRIQLDHLESFISIVLIDLPMDVELLKIKTVDEVRARYEEIISSDFIFCDLHFSNTDITGENILGSVLNDELFKGEAMIMTGDIVAAERGDNKYRYISKSDMLDKDLILRIVRGV